MPSEKYSLAKVVGSRFLDLQEHLSTFVGEQVDELLSGDYTLINGYYGLTYVNTFFLNTDYQNLNGYIIPIDGNFVFIILGHTNEEDGLYGCFPIQSEAISGATLSNENPPINYKIIVPPVDPGIITWQYVYFSTDNHDRQLALWKKYEELVNPEITIELEEFISLVESQRQYQEDTRTLEANLALTPADQEKWRGGLYLSNSVTKWPFDFINDHGNLFGLATSVTGFSFQLFGSVFYPKYLDIQVQYPVFHGKVPLEAKDYTNSFITRTELALEFFSKSAYSSESVEVLLRGKIFLDNNKYALSMSANWPIGNGLFEFEAQCKINEIPFFDHTLIPGLENSTELGAKVLTRVMTTDRSFHSSSFVVTLENWAIIPDILSLKELEFSCSIFNTSQSKELVVGVDAKALLGKTGIEVDCGGSYPDGQFYFALNPSTPIHLHEIVAAFFGNQGGLPDHFEITELSGQFNYNTKDLYFSIAIAETDSWTFADIELTKIRLAVSGQGSLSGSIYAGFAIGSVDFEVSATIGDGWSFEARCDANTLALKDLFTNLGYTQTPKLPDYLANITIDEAVLSFKSPPDKDGSGTNSKVEKHFRITGSDNAKTAIKFELNLDISYPDGNKEDFAFSGHLTVGGAHVFDIVQQKDGADGDKIFLAAYHQEGDSGSEIDISELLDDLGVTNVPSMTISLKDAFFANDLQGTKKFNLLVADVGAGMNLSNLPLIGKVLPADATVALALRVVYASAAYGFGVDKLNAVLPNGISKISKPEPLKDKAGFDLIAEIKIGEHQFILELPIEIKDNHNKDNPITQKSNPPSDQPTKSADNSKTGVAVPVNDGITWFTIGKKFGPVVFNRIGLTYSDGKLTVYPDAALSMGGLIFTLNGLSVSSPITEFKPRFDLKGIGLDFKKDPLEIGASFLRRQIVVDGETIDEYDGMATISVPEMSISALGSYSYYQGHPSLFIYVYLDKALGGPAFFFVEGLAGAFGYNRALIMPTIDQVSNFPLVKQVMAGSDPTTTDADRASMLSTQLDAISKYVPPSIGQMFLAVGIKFNSFKLIDSFAMIAVSFGNHFEIDVLGQSNVIVPSESPKDVPPLAEIKIQLMAKFIPEEGFLGVEAQLTKDSYVLSKDCHLTGGAAFYSWFKDQPGTEAKAGDFVVTMGGYHPSFNVPSHYPQVPRLGLNWQVSDTFSIKGDMYFALCSHAFMAGGHLEALYHDGPLRAWFKAGADFLISWQPYHYDAHMYLDLGASYTYHFFGTHHITLDLGADIHVWGPEFAGEASLHILVFDISVSFGPQGKSKPIPISWKEFLKKCLPDVDKVLSASVTKGQHRENLNGDKKIAVVNPKELKIDLNSAIPITTFSTPAIGQPEGSSSFGVAPMDVANNITSALSISIKKDEAPLPHGERENFIFSPQTKKLPSAVWGSAFSPTLNERKRTIELVTGLTITTKEPLMLPNGNTPEGTAGIDFDIEFKTVLDTSHVVNLAMDRTAQPHELDDFQHNAQSMTLMDDLELSNIAAFSIT